MFVINLLHILITFTIVIKQTGSQCVNDFISNPADQYNCYYRTNQSRVTYADSSLQCTNLRPIATLPTFNNIAEYRSYINFLYFVLANPNTYNWWIGLSQTNTITSTGNFWNGNCFVDYAQLISDQSLASSSSCIQTAGIMNLSSWVWNGCSAGNYFSCQLRLTPASSGCPTNWYYDPNIPNVCYYSLTLGKTWSDAFSYCNTLTTFPTPTPAILLTENEFASFQDIAKSLFDPAGQDYYWFGMKLNTDNASMIWLDGSPITTSHWYTPFDSTDCCLSWNGIDSAWYPFACTFTSYTLCQMRLSGSQQPTAIADPVQQCPTGWLLSATNQCYLYDSASSLTWSDALAYCQSLGAGLPIFRTMAEQTAYNNLMISIGVPTYEQHYLGLFYNGVNWAWIDNSLPAFNFWYPNQPSGDGNCCDMMTLADSNKWNDYNCAIILKFACQMSVLPQTTTPADTSMCVSSTSTTSLTSTSILTTTSLLTSTSILTSIMASLITSTSTPSTTTPSILISTSTSSNISSSTPTTSSIPMLTSASASVTNLNSPSSELLTTAFSSPTTSKVASSSATSSSTIIASATSVLSSTSSSATILNYTSMYIMNSSKSVISTSMYNASASLPAVVTTQLKSDTPTIYSTSTQQLYSLASSTSQISQSSAQVLPAISLSNYNTTVVPFAAQSITIKTQLLTNGNGFSQSNYKVESTSKNADISSTMQPIPSVLISAGIQQSDLTDPQSIVATIQSLAPILMATLNDSMKRQIGQDLSDLVRVCSYDRADCFDESNFVYMYDPTYGNCYNFNSGNEPKYEVVNVGLTHGIRLLLGSSQQDYSCTSMNAGFRLVFQQNNMPSYPDSEGYSIAPGTVTYISLTQTSISRINSANTPCAESVFGDFIYNYTVESCTRFCIQRAIVASCNCLSPMYPSIPYIDYCGLKQKSCMDYISSCTDNVLPNCHCPPPCEEIVFTPVMTSSKLISTDYKAPICNSSDNVSNCLNTFDENFGLIYIYYETLKSTHLAEVSSYSLQNFMSDGSGVTGILLGVCVISVIEVGSLNKLVENER